MKTVKQFKESVNDYINEIENTPIFTNNTDRVLFKESMQEARIAIVEALSYVKKIEAKGV